MKRFLLVSLFLFSTSVFAQQTIDFETVGNTWVWNAFDLGSGSSGLVTNPNPSGLNTSSSCLNISIGPNGNPWGGVYCTDFPDMLITADNCIVKILVYKDVITPFNLKLEPPNQDHFTSNTLINQWEELVFDYSSDIGTTGITLTLIPDQKPDFPRTYASVNYIDNIRFTPLNPPARVQVIHNSADVLAGSVDIYINGALAIPDFAFRTATPFIDLTSAVTLNIGVAPGNSTSVTDTLKNFPVVLAPGEKYVVIANGLLTGGYLPNPDGRNTDFTLFVKPMARETAVGSGVDFFVLHGATDAPAVDVQVNELGGATIVDNAAYGDITSYLNAPAQDLTLDLYLSDGTTYVASFVAPLAGLDGGSASVFASGFLDPAANQNGKAFGLFAALANGDVVQFLPPPPPPGSTIDFETVGNSWVWNAFDLGTGSSGIVANPNPSGLNTSSNCLNINVGSNGNPWGGVYCTDFPDMLITADNCIVKILVYKDVITPFNLKLEPPNQDHFTSNTLINQWEELTFDYSSHIGTTGITLTLIPDQKPDFPRTYSSVNYIDYIRFTSNVVPVELTSFTGAFVGNNVELKWSTATELNNRGFEIQRSIDGSQFATVAFVEGQGTTTEQKQYTFTDRNVTAGVNHAYRLKQIDFDGTFEFSSVVNVGSAVPVEFALEQNYPNPFNPTTNIIYSVPVKSNVTLDVYNLIGQKVITLFEGEIEAGKHSSQFNASSMSSGIYLFKLTAVGENGAQFSSSKKMTLLK